MIHVLQEILDIGKGLPIWQQASLQMLYEKESLSAGDIRSLAALCKQKFGLDVEVSEPPELTLAGAGASVNGTAVVLTSISNTKNANALRDGESLTFAGAGLTIVFGDNGAGKSGYVRILKQSCHARGSGDHVLRNIYQESDDPPAATITYEVAGEARTYPWTGVAKRPEELGSVCVLDSKSAVVYANDEQPAVFLPFGLDLFPRLAGTFDRVAAELEQERAGEERKRDSFLDIASGTLVRTLLNALPAEHSMTRLSTIRVLTPEEKTRATALQQEISRLKLEDPAKLAIDLEQRAARFRRVSERVRTLSNATSEERAAAIDAARAALTAAEAAAAQVTNEAFGHFPIQGLAHESWQVLWDAALRFAQEGATPVQVFPPVAGLRCVLCQQLVDKEAANRLTSFRDFLTTHTLKTVADAKSQLTDALEPLTDALPGEPFERTIREEINSVEPELGSMLDRLLLELGGRAEALNNAKPVVPPVPEALELVSGALTSLTSALSAQAAVLRAGVDPTRLSDVEKELDELLARVKLGEIWDRVEADCTRGQRIRALEAAIKDAGTGSITKKGKKLLAEAVSQPLAGRFNQIIADLKLKHVPIEIAPMRGHKGGAVHRIQLSAQPGVQNVEILSEGELRAIAIAGFLAEVEGQHTASTVVFDDPVSSLDFARREYVAQALTGVAMRRPVVVFTHDPVFLWMLATAADQAGVVVSERQLRRVGQDAGIVSDSIGWSGRPARQRIGPLRDRARRLERLQKEDPAKYEQEVRNLYRDLRDAWERGIEDCLLNESVKRFDKRVETLRLTRLHRVTEDQIMRMTDGMSKCSEYSHDQPAQPGMMYPDPPGVQADVDECDAWMKELSEQYNRK